jgi:hypothetical protein
MPNPVTVPDLVNRFRPLNALEDTMAQALLVDAWEELLAPGKVPDLEDRLADGRVSEGLVRRVVTAMVLRVLRNPDAIRQLATDDVTITRDQVVSSGLLYASEDEVALLTGQPTGELPHVSFSAPYGWL